MPLCPAPDPGQGIERRLYSVAIGQKAYERHPPGLFNRTGRICPECGRPVPACSCEKKKAAKTDRQMGWPKDGAIRIQREVKGHNGKTVTAVFGVPLENAELQKFAKMLRRRCGPADLL